MEAVRPGEPARQLRVLSYFCRRPEHTEPIWVAHDHQLMDLRSYSGLYRHLHINSHKDIHAHDTHAHARMRALACTHTQY